MVNPWFCFNPLVKMDINVNYVILFFNYIYLTESILSGSFYFCYPFTIDTGLFMMIFYRFLIWCIKKAKKLILLFVIHQVKVSNSEFIYGRLLQFFKVSSSNPFRSAKFPRVITHEKKFRNCQKEL